MRVAKKERSGILWVNAYHSAYHESPWGGYKQGGIGRDVGTYGLEEYMEVRQINVNMSLAPLNDYKGEQGKTKEKGICGRCPSPFLRCLDDPMEGEVWFR